MGSSTNNNDQKTDTKESRDLITNTHDAVFYRIALVALSFIAIGGLVAAVILPILNHQVPPIVENLSSVAVGALAGLLVKK